MKALTTSEKIEVLKLAVQLSPGTTSPAVVKSKYDALLAVILTPQSSPPNSK